MLHRNKKRSIQNKFCLKKRTKKERKKRRLIQSHLPKQIKKLDILVDLSLFEVGGVHGGIKPALYRLLQEVQKDRRLILIVLIQKQLVDEITSELGETVKTQVCDASTTVQNIVDVHHPDLLFSPLPSLRFRYPDLPLIFLSPDLLHLDYPESLLPADREYRQNLLLEATRSADIILTVSNFSRERFIEHYRVPRDLVRVIPHALPKGVYRQNKSGRRPKPHFLYPANFWKHKNHKTLLVGYKKYTQLVSCPWHLVLTGHPESGDSEAIRKSIEVLQLQNLVEFRGYLTGNAYLSAWADSGALVFPSNYEGFGLPLLEAMEWEIPILAADLPSLREVAESAALFIDQKSPDQIGNGLFEISKNVSLRDHLVRKGRERKREFNWKHSAEAFSKLAVSLISRKSGGGK